MHRNRGLPRFSSFKVLLVVIEQRKTWPLASLASDPWLHLNQGGHFSVVITVQLIILLLLDTEKWIFYLKLTHSGICWKDGKVKNRYTRRGGVAKAEAYIWYVEHFVIPQQRSRATFYEAINIKRWTANIQLSTSNEGINYESPIIKEAQYVNRFRRFYHLMLDVGRSTFDVQF